MAILGIDEVGRGPLAGPLVVGAVILPELEWVSELRDSKKISAKKREIFSEMILREAATGLGFVMAEEIDAIGISEALMLATRRAVKSVQRLHKEFSQIVIDGKVNFLKQTALEGYVSTVVKADDLIKEVSAASIIAKVARDRYMIELAERFPGYGFETHVGYGTAKHIAAIREFGICEEHRKSFEPIRSMVGFSREDKPRKNTTLVGKRAEEAVAKYLTNEGHQILMQNFKTRYCEIDIVSKKGDKIYFTEVKYRYGGGGLEAVNGDKRRQMEFAAKIFLNKYKQYDKFNPLLAVSEVEGDNYEVKNWFPILF